MLSIKFNYAALFLKLVQSWFHLSARSFDPYFDTLLLAFSAFGCFIFLPYGCETFLILWNRKSMVFVLRMPFIVVYWYPTQCFLVFLIVGVFVPIIAMTKSIGCIWKFFRLVAFSCVYLSWSSFNHKLKLLSGWRSLPYFAPNIVKSSYVS